MQKKNKSFKKIDYTKSIFAAARQIGLDDDARRDLQLRITGKSSLTLMTEKEKKAVLSHLNGRRLFAPKTAKTAQENEWRFVFLLPEDRAMVAKKIYRICQSIGKAQNPPLPVMPVNYVLGIARQMKGLTGQDAKEILVRPELLTAAEWLKILQALQIQKQRMGRGVKNE